MAADRAADGTGALEKALDVLDAIGQAPAGLSQAELAERLALPRTTLYRLLGTLSARGLLRRDPLRRVYCLGQRCFEYARSAYAMPDLVAAATSELRALRDMTGETVYLATRDGLEAVAVERCDGMHSQRSQSALGQRKPLHCTSQGKAMLAAMPVPQREALVRDLTLIAVTPHSFTDRRRLLADLRLTATRGFAIDDEEIVPGVRCCGAAIVDGAGQVRGAISVAGPAFRLTTERVQLLGPEVAEAARRVGAQLPLARAESAPHEVVAVSGGWAFDGGWPIWHCSDLLWTDQLAPAVHRTTDGSDELLARLSAPVRVMLPHADGLAIQTPEGWLLMDRQSGETQALPGWPHRPFPAACVGPDGLPWVCVADGERWRVMPLLSESGPLPGWRLSEPATAMGWDASGERLFVATAGSGALQLAQPGSSALRRLATVPKGSGQLAGVAADAQGGVWVALRGGWSVAHFSEDGSMDRVVAMPVPSPTALAFGGHDGQTLFITTARDQLGREALDAAPLSGRLFTLQLAPT